MEALRQIARLKPAVALVDARAKLQEANLREANLREAKLHGAKLRYAFFYEANLQGANFEYADLQGAKLQYANLQGATVTDKQLARTHELQGATMPDGQTLKGPLTPDAPTFKEWLKSHGRGEEEKSEQPPVRRA